MSVAQRFHLILSQRLSAVTHRDNHRTYLLTSKESCQRLAVHWDVGFVIQVPHRAQFRVDRVGSQLVLWGTAFNFWELPISLRMVLYDLSMLRGALGWWEENDEEHRKDIAHRALPVPLRMHIITFSPSVGGQRHNDGEHMFLCNKITVLLPLTLHGTCHRAQTVMTTCNYGLDAFSFLLSSLITPVSLYYYLSRYPFVFLSSLPLYSYHSLARTAWTMTHSDDSGCTTSLFS